MRLGADQEGASPLAVIAVFVLVAAGATALGFFLFFDRPDPAIRLAPADDPADGFRVESAQGRFEWSGVEVQFIDAAGEDRARLYLELPEGRIDAGDAIVLRHQVPAGSYLLRIVEDGTEVARLVARF